MKPDKELKRIHRCLLGSCSEYFKEIGVPVEFAWPAVATCISAVIGKKYYMETVKGVTGLNGFRFIVSGPGSGKSLTIKFVKQVIEQTQYKVPIMPASVTKSSLVDELANDKSRVMMGLDAADQLNAGTILASEYGVLIGEHVTKDFYHTMCMLFDGENYTETRRHMKGETLEIHSPYLNVLAGTPTHHWGTAFPREAWSLGYASRCDFAFSDVKEADVETFRPIVRDRNAPAEERIHPFIREFAHDLQCLVTHVIGEAGGLNHKPAQAITFSPDGWETFLKWYKVSRITTEFKDPWLLDYNSRRGFRLWRDCAIMCLARADTDFFISSEDVMKVLGIHAESEEMLIDYLHRLQSSEDGDTAKSIWAWGCKVCLKTKKPIPYGMFKEYVAGKVDQHKVDKIIKYLVDVGAFEETKSFIRADGIKVNMATPVYVANYRWGEYE